MGWWVIAKPVPVTIVTYAGLNGLPSKSEFSLYLYVLDLRIEVQKHVELRIPNLLDLRFNLKNHVCSVAFSSQDKILNFLRHIRDISEFTWTRKWKDSSPLINLGLAECSYRLKVWNKAKKKGLQKCEKGECLSVSRTFWIFAYVLNWILNQWNVSSCKIYTQNYWDLLPSVKKNSQMKHFAGKSEFHWQCISAQIARVQRLCQCSDVQAHIVVELAIK